MNAGVQRLHVEAAGIVHLDVVRPIEVMHPKGGRA